MTVRKSFFHIMKEPPVRFAPRGGEPYPIWSRMTLETHSLCNRSCRFCPVAYGRRDGPMELMEWDLLERILEQTRALGWGIRSGRAFVEMFGINEPFLSKRLPRELELIRRSAPKATIYISTNGDVLAKHKDPVGLLRTIREAGANSINLNVYDGGQAGIDRLAFYLELIGEAVAAGFARHNEEGKYKYRPLGALSMATTDMREEKITARAPGKMDIVFPKPAEQRRDLRSKPKHCARPHRHLFIDYKGRVPLCCAVDPSAPAGGFVGNVNDQSLLEVWNSERMFMNRYFLQSGRRAPLPDCDTCLDAPAFPHVVRKVTASKSRIAAWERSGRDHERKQKEALDGTE